MFTYDPDLPRRRAVNRRLPISTATKVCCSIALSDRSDRRTRRLSRNRLSVALRELRPTQKKDFDYRITAIRCARADGQVFQGLRRTPIRCRSVCERWRSVGLLSRFDDISDPKQRMVASFRLIGKMPTLAAMAYKYSLGQPFIYPKNDLDYSSNFLRMCYACRARTIRSARFLPARSTVSSFSCRS